ncbi:gamma-glutamyltransferase [bacterium]|nr:gamma-glutamyltransferase [bacterium]
MPFYQASMDFSSRRSPVTGRRGMIATSQPLAVAAGLEILQKGGNAADAAVATAAALNVTEPTSTGLGGDCFALFYEAKTKNIHALNGSGRSPIALSLEVIQKAGFQDGVPLFHPHSITVPGAAAGWSDLVTTHGKLSLEQVLTPAIRLAEEGFPVAPITAYFWERGAARQLSNAPNGHELTINGRAPRPGETFQNLGLARTMKKLALDGPSEFYQGEIAEAIVKVIQEEGGLMSLEDLANHHSTWETPISTTYRGYRVWECPPNGQGLTALLALNILEGFDLQTHDPLSAPYLHLLIEALRLAFADTRWFVADPETNPAPLEELLSKAYANERRKEINLHKATLDQSKGTPTSSSDTVYLTVVDGEGNACSFINSNYMGFGTGFVPRGWGFTLQNRGQGFSLESGHPNQLAPGKRPYHTIIPALITHQDTNELFASYGVMGGFMQPQGHVQVAVNLIDHLLDPQQALDQPRFCIGDGTPNGQVALENGIPIETMSQLAQMGHPIIPTSGHGRAIFGRGQIILRDRETHNLWGGSDPRADGLAMTII